MPWICELSAWLLEPSIHTARSVCAGIRSRRRSAFGATRNALPFLPPDLLPTTRAFRTQAKTTLAFGAQMIGFGVEPTSAWTSSVADASAPCASSVTSAASALGTTHSRTVLVRGLPVAPLPQPAKCSAPYSPALPVSLPFSPLSVSTASTAYTAPLFNAAVLPSCASTNIDVDALEAQLSILPNQHFVNALINGLRYGFHIGFSSPRFSVCAPNRPSALEHREVVSAAIAKEVERGHTVGPFPTPPFPVFACSPLGCVPKPDSWRLILDLSAPAGSSVNDGIPVENGAVQYVRFDQIIRMIAQLGRGALIANVDLKHAFRQCPVHPDD